MSRSSSRDVRIGLFVLIGIVTTISLVTMAGNGPGFLAKKRAIDVVFRNGQGVRTGCPVRVAGIDAGRVSSVDLAEVDGVLKARVRLSITADLADKLRQDVQITIQTSLTGQTVLNIVSSGRSEVALVAGQVVQGLESSMFDPVMEQVGFGPPEREHLRHTIAEIRQTVDMAGPRLRTVFAAIQETTTSLQETLDTVKPRIASTAEHVENMAARLSETKVDELLKRLESLTARADALIADVQPKLSGTLTNLQDLTYNVNEIALKGRPGVLALIDGFNATRIKADGVLTDAKIITGQGAQIVTKNRGDIERVLANVRDATDYGLKLVQKIYANPFYLSPFYKPKPEDIRAEMAYDMMLNAQHAAKALSDASKNMDSIRQQKDLKSMTPQELKAYNDLYARTDSLLKSLKQTLTELSQGLNSNSRRQ